MARTARALGAVLIVVSFTAASPAYPKSIPLPEDFAPEGIAVGYGHQFYVGSLTLGDVYAGNLRSGEGSVLVDAPPGRSAAGLKVDESHGWLVVAGGPTGHGYVYDAHDGSEVADLTLTTATATLVNDVVVTRQALWFTDSFNPVLYKVPIVRGGQARHTGHAGSQRPGRPATSGVPEPQRDRGDARRIDADRQPHRSWGALHRGPDHG